MSDGDAGVSGTPEAASSSLPRARTNYLKSFGKFFLLGGYTLSRYLIFVFLRTLTATPEAKTNLVLERAHRWMKRSTRLAGFQVECRGQVPEGSYLIAPNHLSYADIIVLGSIFKCFFVAKDDVESWPIIGFLFKQTEQISVPRNSRRGVLATNKRVGERLTQGQSVCVFLEGTSSGGGEVLPFHASLLQPALDAGVPVVPVAIRWTCEQPGVNVEEDIAYWKDHTLVPHLIRLLGLGGCRAIVTIGEPTLSGERDRKTWAVALHDEVASMLEEQ
ncbi:MAG: hypothetical protein COA73_13910 [Candidatus Hydrogenedentota bacterium]|nr:MAG: hypothetical protein COA73_13910 [Candidatus Hydrogenedentota bacterium]